MSADLIVMPCRQWDRFRTGFAIQPAASAMSARAYRCMRWADTCHCGL